MLKEVARRIHTTERITTTTLWQGRWEGEEVGEGEREETKSGVERGWLEMEPYFF